MKRFLLAISLISLMLFAFGCSNDKEANGNETNNDSNDKSTKVEEVELLVSAAASLTDALEDLKQTYEKENEGVTITINPGSSGKLATQIEQGAPSDVFLSASKKDMDTLEEKELIVKDSRIDFTNNVLVLIAHKDSDAAIDSFEDINPEDIEHFSIGEPESVPVGRYTKEVFEHLGLWEPLQTKLVYGSDVRQVLTQVELGNADLGIVYSSDAFISDDVKVLAESNADWHAPIVYPGAVVADSEHQEEAQKFLDYLTSEEGIAFLQKYGFK